MDLAFKSRKNILIVIARTMKNYNLFSHENYNFAINLHLFLQITEPASVFSMYSNSQSTQSRSQASHYRKGKFDKLS
jgi:hypothetical protein